MYSRNTLPLSSKRSLTRLENTSSSDDVSPGFRPYKFPPGIHISFLTAKITSRICVRHKKCAIICHISGHYTQKRQGLLFRPLPFASYNIFLLFTPHQLPYRYRFSCTYWQSQSIRLLYKHLLLHPLSRYRVRLRQEHVRRWLQSYLH